MNAAEGTVRSQDLLAHSQWIQSLAHQLVFDPDRAEDVVQETWLRALEHPPGHTQNLRGWLGTVARNVTRSRGRADARRSEHEAAAARPDRTRPTDELVAEASLQRELTDVVLGLDEPYRTVILMRYFRDQPPREIARRLERPLTTVKTQIQRGLERLRLELDRRHGDRGAWCALVLPLTDTARRATAAGVGNAALFKVALILMTLATSAYVGKRLASGSDRHRTPEVFPTVVASRSAEEPAPGLAGPASEEDARTADSSPAPKDGVVVLPSFPDAPARTYLLRGRVIDLEGRPVTEASLLWDDSDLPRWKDQGETVIAGEDFRLEVGPELRDRLRADAAELERFVAEHFEDPARGRTLLLGDELPVYRARTDDEGRFQLEVPDLHYALSPERADLALVGHGFAEHPDGRIEWLGVVSPSRTVVGRVVDEHGEPRPGVHAQAGRRFPPQVNEWLALGYGLMMPIDVAVTDEEGRFSLTGIPDCEWLYAQVEDPLTHLVVDFDVLEPEDEHELPEHVVVLPLNVPGAGIVLEGRVLHGDGSPAVGATAALGAATARVDAEGRFTLELHSLFEHQRDLIVFEEGYAVEVLEGFGEGLLGRRGIQRGPTIRLTAPARSIAGTVVDGGGQPLAGVEVWLGDPTRVDGLDIDLEEAASGGRNMARTDATGTFELTGLADRDYELLMRFEGNHQGTLAIPAGTADETIRWLW